MGKSPKGSQPMVNRRRIRTPNGGATSSTIFFRRNFENMEPRSGFTFFSSIPWVATPPGFLPMAIILKPLLGVLHQNTFLYISNASLDRPRRGQIDIAMGKSPKGSQPMEKQKKYPHPERGATSSTTRFNLRRSKLKT